MFLPVDALTPFQRRALEVAGLDIFTLAGQRQCEITHGRKRIGMFFPVDALTPFQRRALEVAGLDLFTLAGQVIPYHDFRDMG